MGAPQRPLLELPEGCGAAAPLLRQMLARNAAERPQTAGQVADELQRILDEAGGETIPRRSTHVHPNPADGDTAVVRSGNRVGANSGSNTTVAYSGETVRGGSDTNRTMIADEGPTVAADFHPEDGSMRRGKAAMQAALTDSELAVGSLIRGRFRIEAMLGQGGDGAGVLRPGSAQVGSRGRPALCSYKSHALAHRDRGTDLQGLASGS